LLRASSLIGHRQEEERETLTADEFTLVNPGQVAEVVLQGSPSALEVRGAQHQ
jgi:hypothetical protein